MNEIINELQLHVNDLIESNHKLQVLNEMNLKIYEEMLSVLDRMEGDTN